MFVDRAWLLFQLFDLFRPCSCALTFFIIPCCCFSAVESLVVEEQPSETKSSMSAVVACSPGYGSQQIPRGGLCVHRPDDNMNGFLLFAQPLMLSLEAKPVTLGATSSEYWKQQLLRLHNEEDDSTDRDKNNSSPSVPPKRGRPSKQRGVKRKLKAESKEEEKKASWELMVTTRTTSIRETAESKLHLQATEEDERVLEFLQLRHDRDVESARVSAMVDLTSGRGNDHIIAIQPLGSLLSSRH